MIIRQILGFYHEPNAGESYLGHIFLERIEYPMTVETPIEWEDGTVGDTTTLWSDSMLREWAQAQFEEWEIVTTPLGELEV